MNELKPEDVMRALELCNFNAECDNCPYVGRCWDLNKDALALLREKDAEIERLTEENKSLRDNTEVIIEMVTIARAEAITEFAERLKARMREVYPADIYDSDIDQIAKEMKGD